MDTFILGNHVRLGISQALLLLYRYLTGIYALGDLSFVHFLSGYVRGKKHTLDGQQILTVSGNGIGELEKMLCLQWKFDYLETMAVNPAQMGIMRLLLDAQPEEVEGFFGWARERLGSYRQLQELFASPGLVAYWQQQCAVWRAHDLKRRVRLFGGSPWDLPETQLYDAILLAHAQRLLCQSDAKSLLSRLKPGGRLAALMPVIFRPAALRIPTLARFSDLPAVQSARQRMRQEARRLSYELADGQPVHVRWALEPEDTVHVVSFSIASPLRSLLIGELLIESLAAEVPDVVRLTLLESALSEASPTAGAGTETLLILLAEKGGA